MKRMNNWLLLVVLTPWGQLSAQQIIHLNNPSFEDKPRCCDVPRGWEYVGDEFETPPDIQPGVFQVKLPPYEGETYVGMVTRDNNTWERMAQTLPDWLMKDSTYSFNMYLARDPAMVSHSRVTQRETLFAQLIVLRIWGNNTDTSMRELLAQSSPVARKKWTLYEFTLNPRESSYNRIELEAYYADDEKVPYNGMLLLDACSPIVQIHN